MRCHGGSTHARVTRLRENLRGTNYSSVGSRLTSHSVTISFEKQDFCRRLGTGKWRREDEPDATVSVTEHLLARHSCAGGVASQPRCPSLVATTKGKLPRATWCQLAALHSRCQLLLTVGHFSFYKQTLKDVYDVPSLNTHVLQQGEDRLRFKKEDLMLYRPDEAMLLGFPDEIRFQGQTFSCEYRFQPGEPVDGVTVKLPSTAAPGISLSGMEGLIPGLYRQKVRALMRGLTKTYRKRLVPLAFGRCDT